MRIVDADAHVVEARELAGEVLKRWPDLVKLSGGERPGLLWEGRRYPEYEGPGAGCPPDAGLVDVPGADPHSVDGMLADASRDHIDEMVLYPSMGLCAPSLRDRGLGLGFSRLYNEWLADWCRRGQGRLHGVAVLPVEYVGDAIQVLKEAKQLGHVAAMLPPALASRNLDHDDLDPLYAAAVELDMPLGIHGAPGLHMPKIGVDRFDNYIQVHCVSFPFDQMTAMTALISGGVFDRFPQLRVAFLESGAGWVPYFIDRLHEHYEKRGSWVRGGRGWQRDPQRYLESGNLWVSCEPEEPILPGVISVLGDEFILFASDYPHWDAAWPESTRHLRSRVDISESSRARIAGENARRFYRL